jgi:hypothetical protein
LARFLFIIADQRCSAQDYARIHLLDKKVNQLDSVTLGAIYSFIKVLC